MTRLDTGPVTRAARRRAVLALYLAGFALVALVAVGRFG